MPSTTNENDPIIVCLNSLDIDMVVDMVKPLMGELQPNVHPISPTESLDMYYF